MHKVSFPLNSLHLIYFKCLFCVEVSTLRWEIYNNFPILVLEFPSAMNFRISTSRLVVGFKRVLISVTLILIKKTEWFTSIISVNYPSLLVPFYIAKFINSAILWPSNLFIKLLLWAPSVRWELYSFANFFVKKAFSSLL